VVLAVAPNSSNGVTAALAVLAAVAEVAVHRIGKVRITVSDRVAYGIAAAALALAGAAQLLGRTDAPLCAPDSLSQGHAFWHVLTAVALGAWSVPSLRRGIPVASRSGSPATGGEPRGDRAPRPSPPAS
jgi:hypothetical protein